MLQKAKKRFSKNKNITFLHKSYLDADFKPSSFDLITISFATRFVPKDQEEQFAKIVYNLLKKSGIFMIVTMDTPEKKLYSITQNLFRFPKGKNVDMDVESYLVKVFHPYLNHIKTVKLGRQIIVFQSKAIYFKKV